MDLASRPTVAHMQALVTLCLCTAALVVASAATLVIVLDPGMVLARLAGQ
jgi:hypothetical protein